MPAGASPGGLWSLLGAGIDGAMKEAMPGATVTYQTSGGGFANVVQLDQGKCDLAIIHDAEATAAIKGEEPFKAPVKSMRTVAVLYTWAPEQFIVRKDFAEEHGIKSMDDIASNKVPIRILLNRRGNVVSKPSFVPNVELEVTRAFGLIDVADQVVVGFFLPETPIPFQQGIDFLCRERFPAMLDVLERIALTRPDDDVHMVWHQAPGKDVVSLAVEVLEGIADDLRDGGVLELAGAVSGV